MRTGWINCPKCKEEYYIQHIKFPFKDGGGSLECPTCGVTLHSWGKGTDDYVLKTKEDMKKWREYEESRPTCKCGAKMSLRKGQYGEFWGCTRYPNCTHTRNK